MISNTSATMDDATILLTEGEVAVLIEQNITVLYDGDHTGVLPWYRHLKLSAWNLTVSIIYGVIISCGLCTNAWVLKSIGIVLRLGTSRTPSVLIYVGALAFLNLLVMISMPLPLSDVFVGHWPFSQFLCSVHWTVESLHKTMASVVLSLLTVACYCAVCHPEMKQMYKSTVCSMAHVFVGFIIIVVISYPTYSNADIFYFAQFEIEQPDNVTVVQLYTRKCLYRPTDEDQMFYFTICSMLCGYAIPMTTMFFCYGSILYTVRFRTPFRKQRVNNFRRVAKVTFLLVSFYLVSWTPYWCVTLIVFNSDSNAGANPTVITTAFFVHLLPYVNCACSTLLYTMFNKQIRSVNKSHARQRRHAICLN